MPDAVPSIKIEAPVKSWWRSKTLWFNALVCGLAAAEQNWPTLQPLLPVNVYQATTFFLVVGNALLRFATSQGLGK